MIVSDLVSDAAKILPNSPSARLDIEWFLCEILECNSAFLWAHPEQVLTQNQMKTFEGFIERRIAGVSVAYILNKKEFFGLEFFVDERVLVPRPETEELIERVLDHPNMIKDTVIDLGTGSGCLPIALVKNGFKRAWGLDVSTEALVVATKNCLNHKLESQIKFVEMDLFNERKRQEFLSQFNEKLDCVVSNPPYISRDDLEVAPEVKKFEPALALFAEDNGLACYKNWMYDFSEALKPKGLLICEIGCTQGTSVRKILEEFNLFKTTEVLQDLSGKDRFVKGVRK